MEAKVVGSCDGGTFAETEAECWGKFFDDDDPAADVDVADDTANNPRDDGYKLIDEENRWRN